MLRIFYYSPAGGVILTELSMYSYIARLNHLIYLGAHMHHSYDLKC